MLEDDAMMDSLSDNVNVKIELIDRLKDVTTHI